MHETAGKLGVGRERVERIARVHGAEGTDRLRHVRAPASTARRLGEARATDPRRIRSVALEDGVVAEVGEQSGGRAARVRHWPPTVGIVTDRICETRDLLEDAAEVVQVGDPEVVELRVCVELRVQQRDEMELARRRKFICCCSCLIAARISRPWFPVRMMSLCGKSCRSRENASAASPFMCCGPAAKYAPEYVSCIAVGTFMLRPPTPSTSDVKPAKSTSTA